MRHQEPLEDWEKALHRELDALPELDAPSSLIAGVMKQINTPATPAWYHTSWWQWPLAMRTTSILLVLAVLGALAWLSGSFGELGLTRQLVQSVGEVQRVFGYVLETGETFLGSGAVFWREHGQLILLAAASMLLATYLTCVAAGTALYQLTWKRTL